MVIFFTDIIVDIEYNIHQVICNMQTIISEQCNLQVIKYEILMGMKECSKRGLKETSKWYVFLNDILLLTNCVFELKTLSLHISAPF